MNTDIPDRFCSENDPPCKNDLNISQSQETDRATEVQETHHKNPTKPRSELDWKVHETGVKQINQPKPIVLNNNHKWSSSKEDLFRFTFDAEAFARYAKRELQHQRNLDELEYTEERIEASRENKAQRLEHKSRDDDDIDLQRYQAA